MLAIVSGPGSRGDVNPMIAIGRELRRRGHEVVISLAENYADIARRADLEPVSLISTAQFDSVVSDPAVWRPVSGIKMIVSGIIERVFDAQLDLLDKRHRPGDTVLISHPLDFSSRVFRDFTDVPLISTHLAPMLLRWYENPPRLTPWGIEKSLMRFLSRTAYWGADFFVLDRMLAKPINSVRRQHGLKPVRRIMKDYWLSPDCAAAMYPDWYAPQTVGLYPQLMHAGFPLEDLEVETFETGEAPQDSIDIDNVSPETVVFTGGTANHHTQDFFERATAICQSTGRPGILLSTHRENFPAELPGNVTACGYVSLKRLLPRVSLIVHHGGIGTTSQALAAGTAQIVRPMAFDQFDNATRVESLGCGVWLKQDSKLAETIERLTSFRETQLCLSEIKNKLTDNPTAASVIADQAERMLAQRRD